MRSLKHKRILTILTMLTLCLTACSSSGMDELNTTVDMQSIIENTSIDFTPKQRVIEDINNLMDCDTETVIRYFGDSDVYTPTLVADRVSVAKLTFTSITDASGNSLITEDKTAPLTNPEDIDKEIEDVAGVVDGDISVGLHICTIDYSKMSEAVQSLTERIKEKDPFITEDKLRKQVTDEVAARATNGEFDIHLNTTIIVRYTSGKSKVVLTEQYKTALTGGWYNPTNLELESTSCPLEEILKQKYEEAVNSRG